MKVQSSVYPSKFYIRKIELGNAYVKLRKNISEITDEEGNINYEFDEVEIKVSDRGKLQDFINTNFESLFQMGTIEENKPKELTDSEKIEQLKIEQSEMMMEIFTIMSQLQGGV